MKSGTKENKREGTNVTPPVNGFSEFRLDVFRKIKKYNIFIFCESLSISFPVLTYLSALFHLASSG